MRDSAHSYYILYVHRASTPDYVSEALAYYDRRWRLVTLWNHEADPVISLESWDKVKKAKKSAIFKRLIEAGARYTVFKFSSSVVETTNTPALQQLAEASE